jgi:hypothetical protein
LDYRLALQPKSIKEKMRTREGGGVA